MVKITTKIKVIIGFLSLLIISIVISTVFLNSKSKKDAYVINISGKQRMLSQKIVREIFYLHSKNSFDFKELDKTIEAFSSNLNDLKIGNKSRNIYKAPNEEIYKKIKLIEFRWSNFFNKIEKFKTKEYNNEDKALNEIYSLSITLLEHLDDLTSIYTIYSEHKKETLESFQYIAGLISIIFIIYSFLMIVNIERLFKKFLNNSKGLDTLSDIKEETKKQEFKNIDELSEAQNHINQFLLKIDSVIVEAKKSIEESKKATKEISNISIEIDKNIKDLNDNCNKELLNYIDKSEDIAIQSMEDLTNISKVLEKLHINLTNILKA